MNKILLPFSFTLMNWAAVAALVHFVRGRKDVWVRSREVVPSLRGRGAAIFHREQQWNY